LQVNFVTAVEDRRVIFAEYRLPVMYGQTWPTPQSHDLFETTELLV